MNDLLTLRAELKRKTIHLGSSLLPILYYFFFNREQIILISGIMSILFLAGEFARFNFKSAARLFREIFFPLLREEEKAYQLTGATYLFLSATVTFFIFDKIFATAAVLILTISDSVAAIIGKGFARKAVGEKTIAGSVTFFLVSIGIIFILVPLGVVKVLGVALVLTIIEAIRFPLSDNFVISISAALLLMLAAAL
jgi:dolichol kinase